MDFLIKLKQPSFQNQNFNILIDLEVLLVTLIERKSAFKLKQYEKAGIKFYVFGDLIFLKENDENHDAISEHLYKHYWNKSLHQLKGFHYIIVFDSEKNTIEIHSCFLNILPVYYSLMNNQVVVSGSLTELISNVDTDLDHEPKYIIEKALFNYAFLCRTPYKNVFLLPSCSYIEISDDGLKILNNYQIEDFIIDNPVSWKKNLGSLSDLYCEEIRNYLPDEPFAITLTGGFDGRTVLSAALQKNTKIQAFSYGIESDKDISIPMKIAEKLGFSYSPFILDDGYAKNLFWENATEFLIKSEGVGNLSRGHYILTSSSLASTNNYLLTGNFGSELIRSMKDSGVMASEALFRLFDSLDRKSYENYIQNSRQLALISPHIIEEGVSSVIEDSWNFRLSLSDGLTKNQKFYVYLFGEVFRKYFGPEIVVQSDYLINRSPFIDYNIFKNTLMCSIAGIYQNFREKRPLKRFHGQVLYSHIMKKLYPSLLYFNLDRNYKPKDFISPLGRLLIIIGYANKNYLHKKNKIIPSYSRQLYDANFEKISRIIGDSKILNREIIKQLHLSGDWKNIQHSFINSISMELFYQIFEKR